MKNGRHDWAIIIAMSVFAIAVFSVFVVYPFYECGWSALAYGDRAFFAAVFGECK